MHGNERRRRITFQCRTILMLVQVFIKGISFFKKVFSVYVFRNERVAIINSGKGFFLWSVNQEIELRTRIFTSEYLMCLL